jgi:hypothetical protein
MSINRIITILFHIAIAIPTLFMIRVVIIDLIQNKLD